MRKLLIKIFRNELQDNMKLDKMAPPKNAPKDAFIKKKKFKHARRRDLASLLAEGKASEKKDTKDGCGKEDAIKNGGGGAAGCRQHLWKGIN